MFLQQSPDDKEEAAGVGSRVYHTAGSFTAALSMMANNLRHHGKVLGLIARAQMTPYR